MQISRRNFLGTVSLSALTFVTSVTHAVPTSAKKYDQSFDVVIVSAGGAGSAAAREASRKGLSVLVLEKEPIVGGSSTICGGKWAVSGSELQKEQGVKDSEELYIKDMLETGKYKNDPDLFKAFVL